MFSKIIDEILAESVSVSDINDAIDNHKRIIINYHTDGEDNATGARVIEVYAYGTTKAGNPVIRAFQPYGDTTSRVPSWKFFRLDRISDWKDTQQRFSRPASDYYHGIGEFNPNGDNTMSIVYKIAKFGNDNSSVESGPKTKDSVFKTDSEQRMERMRQQLQNPIKIQDLQRKKQETPSKPEEKPIPQNSVGPRLKPSAQDKHNDEVINASTPTQTKDEEIYKTPTEQGYAKLLKQLENPIKLEDYLKLNQK